MTVSLSYNSQGQFKIVQFTDLHWGDNNEGDRQTRALMEEVLKAERPDLVVITGDVIEDGTCNDPRQSIRQAVAAMEDSGIAWAIVFGNHDAEARISRQELFDSLKGVRYGITQRGPESITGVGNYVIQLTGRDGNTGHALFFLDSGDYAEARIGGYAHIARDQIDWFVRESSRLAAENAGSPIPSLAFFHIPLPEYNDVWDFEVCRGYKQEMICCPRLNTGMFAAMVEMGNVIGTFVGHDHDSDFCGELHGIMLCYGRKTGYNNYMKPGFAKGARVIVLEEAGSGFRTWLRLEGGQTVMDQPIHQPEEGNRLRKHDHPHAAKSLPSATDGRLSGSSRFEMKVETHLKHSLPRQDHILKPDPSGIQLL
ncbi:metallophosphoesterase [Cohnella pontilimi]|uniref:Metallophosphoesterase n=1 Tax=Cohnella pontilimi TaxID=2564100 RepID=A0A4U0FHU0_9BACL|nr:metallophosphoesterase family protein [Cohnella pontilimi]TJY44537.1 metallophosphoesterase [Cohnella pontilimi]